MSKSVVGISFLMPSYKSAFLEKAIESIIGQTVPDWELIIVDDCSPEDLGAIVSGYQDDRIRYIRNEANIGGRDLVAQWNHCLSFARGEWVVLAADDDEYAPSFVSEVQTLIASYPEVDLVRSRVEQIDGNGCHLYDDGLFPEYSAKEQYLQDWLTGRAFTCIGNFAFRRSALDAIGGFAQYPCAFGSDIETPVRLSAKGVANTAGMLFRFRQFSGHLSADRSRFLEKLSGITQLSLFLRSLDYRAPGCDDRYLQAKCIYDYFNHVIRYVPLKSLPKHLGHCRLAGGFEKFMMVLRWMKHYRERRYNQK